MYMIWSSDNEVPMKMVNLRQLFSANVSFAPGQKDKDIIFYPWTSESKDEWAIVKHGGLDSVIIIGGDLSVTLRMSPGGKMTTEEHNL